MLAVVASGSNCVLSEYATGKRFTVIFSEDIYQGEFYPSIVIDLITVKPTAFINYLLVGNIIHFAPHCTAP